MYTSGQELAPVEDADAVLEEVVTTDVWGVVVVLATTSDIAELLLVVDC